MSKMSVLRKDPSRANNNHSQLYQDLIETLSFLEKLRPEEFRLPEEFDKWRKHRKSTIVTVDSLKKKIDAAFVGCNIARGVGATVGIAGVAALVLGAVLEVKGHKSAAQVIRTSQYCAGASTVTIASSKLLEFGVTRSLMNEIERVIKKDIELTKPLKEWILSSHKVESLFYRLFQCNIASTTFANIIKMCVHCITMLDAGFVEINDLIRDFKSCKMRGMEDLTSEVQGRVLDFFRRVQNNPRLLKPMRAIFRIFEETPEVSEFVKFTTDIFWMGYQTKLSGPLLSLGFGSVVEGCILNAISIASHVVTFQEAVKNIQEGKSKYSESLDKIISALNSELEKGY